MSEFDLISKIQKCLPPMSARVQIGIGDDAAVISSPRGQMVATVDMLVENVHFDWAFCTPHEVGYKALAVNLSDVAAMAAEPLYALISLAIPPTLDDVKILQFYEGMTTLAHEYAIDIIGGNISRSPQSFVADVTVLGQSVHPVLRSGLKAGDSIAVTGPLGASALGLYLLQTQGRQALELAPLSTRQYLRPRPRIREALQLQQSQCVTAMIDISDGLSSDSWHLARASHCEIRLNEAELPLTSEYRLLATPPSASAVELALHGGGDYELLIGLDTLKWGEAVMRDLALRDLVHIIGEVEADCVVDGKVLLRTDHGLVPLPPKGWDHLQMT